MKRTLTILLALCVLAAAAYWGGGIELAREKLRAHAEAKAQADAKAAAKTPLAPAVSVVTVEKRDFLETVLVTGSLVPRDEILVAPEIEGLRVLELKVDEGDTVTKGQVLATLVADTLDAQLAENDAQLARANAAIAQAKRQIAAAAARAREATTALGRARPLQSKGWIAESTLDQRESAAKSTQAQVVAARDGLKVAEADKAQVEARRREIDWRRGNVEVKSPADGLVSRRTARVGGLALAAGESMFRIIADGAVELDGEVPEARLAKLAANQKAHVEIVGAGTFDGKVRLVSPEVDRATRLGRVRILLGSNPQLRIGGFARGTVETAAARALAVPRSAVLYGSDGPTVQVVENGLVRQRAIVLGMRSEGFVEVKSGLSEGDVLVAKAGTFLRDGDAVRPMAAPPAPTAQSDAGAIR